MASSSSSKKPSSSSKKPSDENSAFSRRRSTLIKKAQELSTLCGVDVCVICYGPDGSLQTFPKDAAMVKGIASKYRSLDQTDRRNKSLNLSFFMDKIKNNRGKNCRDSSDLATRVDGLSSDQLSELHGSLDRKLRSLKQRLMVLDSQKQKAAAEKIIDNPQITSSCEPILGQTHFVNPNFSDSCMEEQSLTAMLGGNAFSDSNSLQHLYFDSDFNPDIVPPQMTMMMQQNPMGNSWSGSLGFPGLHTERTNSGYMNINNHNKNGCDSMDLATGTDGFSSDHFSELDGFIDRELQCLKQRIRALESRKQKVAAKKIDDNTQITSSCQPILGQTHLLNPNLSDSGMEEQNVGAMFSDYNSQQYNYCNPHFNRDMVPSPMQQNFMGNGWPCNLGFPGMNTEQMKSGFLAPQGYMNSSVYGNDNLMFNNDFSQQPQFQECPVLHNRTEIAITNHQLAAESGKDRDIKEESE